MYVNVSLRLTKTKNKYEQCIEHLLLSTYDYGIFQLYKMKKKLNFDIFMTNAYSYEYLQK